MLRKFINPGLARAVLATFVALSANTAHGADMLGEPTFEEPVVTEVEFGTGWYIRGDIGASVHSVKVDTTRGRSANYGITIPADFGFGYKLTDYLRLETNLTHFANLDDTTRSKHGCGSEVVDGVDTPITGRCYQEQSGSPTMQTFMANVYFDLPTLAGFTPYVGAGAGFSMVSLGSRDNLVTTTEHCVGRSDADCGADFGAGDNVVGESEYKSVLKFAPAANVTVGAAYALSKQLSLDVGYRMTYLGGVKRYSGEPSTRSHYINDVRVGLRYELW